MLNVVLRAIEEGRTHDLLADHDGCPPGCPFPQMIRNLDAAYSASVEQGLTDWLGGASHEPACGRDYPGDLVRWLTLDGQRLPTIRVDLVDKACAREVYVKRDGGNIDLVTFLARSLTPEVRQRFARSQAVLG